MQIIMLLLTAFLLISSSSAGGLSPDYYSHSCPGAESIVAHTVSSKQKANPTTAAGTLRLFFHDCFVTGCDASILISHGSSSSERSSDINLSLPGDAFDLVLRAKAALELRCPAQVSCADILTLATRDLVSILGGPFYPVLLGRKDSLFSRASDADSFLPRTNMSASQLIRLFRTRGFSLQEMVALAGAHTVGFSHCKEFASRIYNYENKGWGVVDPRLDMRFAKALQRACANYLKDPTLSTFNDVMTPGRFDNVYYQNLRRGLGLLASDSVLMADRRTRPFVLRYASNQTLFFEDFAKVMQKLSLYGVKTGREGEQQEHNHISSRPRRKPRSEFKKKRTHKQLLLDCRDIKHQPRAKEKRGQREQRRLLKFFL
ncbi:Peroxidase [Rhynchospora pubera]|uniref:Peroxidase n=1 Tax=Rhynchospora pubera TaxID=906938 RepID=A0AAV8CBD4_9POAL|nr:Peroxidase [Rhynchospora pubera]